MNYQPLRNTIRIALMMTLLTAAIGNAQTGFDVYRFPKGGERGYGPYAGLLADKNGNLYGTTQYGGTGSCTFVTERIGCGTVFRLTPPTSKGGTWTETVLYDFQGSTALDGYFPIGGVIFDSAGILYGTAQFGGASEYGVIFELSPTTSQDVPWNETILYAFDGYPVGGPSGSLTFDGQRNLYGTTGFDAVEPYCVYICSSAFELLRPTTIGGTWTENMLTDGEGFNGGLVLDGAGNVYIAAVWGGSGGCTVQGCGAIYELSPGNPWSQTLLYAFGGGTDGMNPVPGLVWSQGNLYGVTSWGGAGTCSYNGGYYAGCGTVFELSPSASGGWTETVLYRFQGGTDGAIPSGALVTDQKGNLYGTTSTGGNRPCVYLDQTGCGTVFKLQAPTTPDGVWTKTTLFEFSEGDGFLPVAPLVYVNGALYGTTMLGGNKCPRSPVGGIPSPSTCGTVFKVVP